MATRSKYSEGSNISALGGSKILAYPLELGNKDKDEYGKDFQFMMFKINSNTESSRLREDKDLGDVYIANTQTGTGIGTAGSNLAINPSQGDPFAKNKAIQSQYGSKYSEDQIKRETWTKKKNLSRTDRVIVLPMPNRHTLDTSIVYTDKHDQSLLTQAADTMNQGLSTLTGAYTVARNAILAGVNRAQAAILSGVSVTSMQDLMAEEGKAMNPKKEVMFESFGFRNFTFDFTFVPKNQVESEAVNEIIESFRFYSLPEIHSSKLYYLLPGEFEISFMLGSVDNPNIPRIDSCVCKRVMVDYSPNQRAWTTLPNGAPVALNMKLDFLELSLIDRNRVYNKDSAITSGY